MADKMRLGSEVRELKIGSSFMNNKSTSFHTLKCDFKPASVDANKMATVDIGSNNQVTVTVPHLDGAGIPKTVFKGNQRPYQKECVLIIDKVTGEFTLEKLSSNIQVKKTRQEAPHKPVPPAPSSGSQAGGARPHTPITELANNTQRSTSRTRVTSGGRKGGTPTTQKTSPPRHRTSPPQAAPWTINSGQSTLASLPMIGLDDLMQPSAEIPQPHTAAPSQTKPVNGHNAETRNIPSAVPNGEDLGGLSSSSSSSSSGSDSEHSDGSDSEAERRKQPPSRQNPPVNGGMNGNSTTGVEASMPVHLLTDDLRLSESGSDSD